MDPVVHFEIPYKDGQRISVFYSAAFGWQSQTLGEGFDGYITVATTEIAGNGRPKNPGAINGGYCPARGNWPGQFPSVVIAIKDIRDSMKKVTEAGGKVLVEPQQIPGIGLYI